MEDFESDNMRVIDDCLNLLHENNALNDGNMNESHLSNENFVVLAQNNNINIENQLLSGNLVNDDLISEQELHNDNESNSEQELDDNELIQAEFDKPLTEEQERILKGVKEAHRILTTTKRPNGKPWNLFDASRLAKINEKTYRK